MRFITCASYHGTGSSAITRFVSEFETVYSFSEDEFRFLQDMDGIDDLRYHLIDNHNRHNSGHALKRYKRLVDFYNGGIQGKKYRAYFGDNWKKFSYEYMEKLTDFTFKGWWFYDLYDRGMLYYIWKRAWPVVLKQTIWRNADRERDLNTLKNEITYCSRPTEDAFIRLTKEYIEKLFGSVCPQDKIAMVDQILPPSNINRYTEYFDDIKVVVVERDPRDLWTLQNYVWKDGVFPKDVETFCKWYKYTRAHRKDEKYDDTTTKLLQFEDLIYHYEETTQELMKWLCLSPEKHIHKMMMFSPEASKKNTQVWLQHKVPEEAIRYIEKELAEYLYNFPK